MISPDFRATDATNLQDAFKNYIIKNHGTPTSINHLTHFIIGDSLYKDLEPEFSRVSFVRKEITTAMQYRSDPAQLRKIKDLFLE
jgi:hypothetical protein